MEEVGRLLRLRKQMKQKLPKFIRQECWRYKRVHEPWRRPKGIDNKVRKKRKGFIKMPDIGYRTPRKVRGFHPSGKKEVIITQVNELDAYNPEEYIIRISGKLGLLKKLDVYEKAEELGFKVINKPIIEKEEPEVWEKLYELETEEIEPEIDEEYTETLEEEGSLEGLPEFELEEDKKKKSKPKKSTEKKKEVSEKKSKAKSSKSGSSSKKNKKGAEN
ncbi:MAG: 50S ribosomal protein L32e [Candidatus Odinarchaeia archaeon]